MMASIWILDVTGNNDPVDETVDMGAEESVIVSVDCDRTKGALNSKLPYCASSVSYTHLDVYKRQLLLLSVLTESL